MKRRKARPNYDKRHFQKTATNTRLLNVKPIFKRGGVRL